MLRKERASRRVEEREWNRSGNGKGLDRVKSGKGERKEELEGGVGGARARVMCLCRWFRFAQLAKGKKSRP